VVNPQLENGFLKISNEFWEAVCQIRISGEARQVFDFIIRKTWGFNKKAEVITRSQFTAGTGISRQNVNRAILLLKSMNLIIEEDYEDSKKYRINKNFEAWNPQSKATQKRVENDSKSESKTTQKKGESKTTQKRVENDSKSESKTTRSLHIKDIKDILKNKERVLAHEEEEEKKQTSADLWNSPEAVAERSPRRELIGTDLSHLIVPDHLKSGIPEEYKKQMAAIRGNYAS